MGMNGYFQLIHKKNQICLKVVPPTDDGSMFSIDELIQYLDAKKISHYDLVKMNQYIKNENYKEEFVLEEEEHFLENEEMNMQIQPRALSVIARFYPPSSEGGLLTKEEILRTLTLKGVKHGIDESAVDLFLQERKYCTDYIVAKATPAEEGIDAEIQYHFDTNVTARPKLNEDGSVDFHQLGHIKPVKAGELLATLKPANKGKSGIDVLGNEVKPKKVRVMHLRFGRNIQLSEDKCSITSKVAGHVTLVDDMVVVSDVYQVTKNVDTSTGDIEYSGSVEIPGNVLTGYTVKAEGDIIVNGVVEGARIESGGNVILKNGMQGMSKGVVIAKGNVVAKYMENCTVEAGGDVMSDAMIHTNVLCNGKIEVTGRKGLITGGHVKTYGNIIASNIGSSMGTDTKVEILPDTEFAKKLNQLEKNLDTQVTDVKKLDQIIVMLSGKVKKGEKLSEKEANYLKLTVLNRKKFVESIEEMNFEIEGLRERIDSCKDVRIRVSGDVYSGVKIVIKDCMKIMRENVSHCQFIRDGADVRMTAY